jgi:hypothetical protein
MMTGWEPLPNPEGKSRRNKRAKQLWHLDFGEICRSDPGNDEKILPATYP